MRCVADKETGVRLIRDLFNTCTNGLCIVTLKGVGTPGVPPLTLHGVRYHVPLRQIVQEDIKL